jgi:Lon protease-like protein/tetratricopeptide (TPR) repeat protein
MSEFTELEEPIQLKKFEKNSRKRRVLKPTKASSVLKKSRESIALLMSCFDRDHRVVVQRRNSAGTITKNGQPPASTSTTAVRAPAPGAPPVPTTPRLSKTAHANSTIKLKNLKERLSEDGSMTEDQKLDLEIEYADCLCDLGRFREAATIYARVFGNKQIPIPGERLRHFIKALTKITVESVANAGVSLTKFEASDNAAKKEKLLLYLPGQTCPDPLSCPVCAGVFSDPITLPCGHSYCRKCIAKTPALKTSCLKCGSHWRPADCLEPSEAGIEEKDIINHLKPNVLMGKLVQRYWSDDLKAMQLKAKANSLNQQGQLEKAVSVYSEALSLSPTDYFLYGNRSLSYYQLGKYDEALADAIRATEVKPDWAKGYFRKGAALQAIGRHEEAFQAFYECLTLEEEKATKQVKQELARELFALLAGEEARSRSRNRINSLNSDSDESAAKVSKPNNTMDLDEADFVIPLSMVALVEYASTASSSQGPSQLAASLPTWMTRGVTPFRIKSRPLQTSAVVDSADYECPLCIQPMVSPATTPCGHTFCRRCLDRALDHNAVCPLCKSVTLSSYLAERREAMDEFVDECMRRFIPDEYSEREKSVTAELMELAGISAARAENSGSIEEAESCSEVPIFVCTISFPNVRCPLHIFEPRYRLMVRRTMEVGTRQFGMTCKVRASEPFSEYGTMLEIRDIHVFRDGRSVIDTRGRRRFRVLERRVRDGYNVATVEFIKDVPIPQEQREDLMKLHDDTLEKTREWFSAMDDEMKRRFENHYGDMPNVETDYWDLPNGPAWHWWTIAILPLDPQAQVQVLSLTSLKRRLETIQRILKYLQSASK